MRRLFRAWLRDERGEDLIEYGLLIAFAAALVMAVLFDDALGLRAALLAAFTSVRTALNV